jgi:hypothetical protein
LNQCCETFTPAMTQSTDRVLTFSCASNQIFKDLRDRARTCSHAETIAGLETCCGDAHALFRACIHP